MQSMPRPVLIVVAALLGAAGLFGLVSGVTTSLGRSGPPEAPKASGLPAADQILDAQPIDELAPPPPPVAPEKTPEEKAAEAKKAAEDKQKKDDAAKAKAQAALPAGPEAYTPPADSSAAPSEAPVINPAPAPPPGGPTLY